MSAKKNSDENEVKINEKENENNSKKDDKNINNNNPIKNVEETKVNLLKFKNIPLNELESHLKMLKNILIKYNSFDYDNTSFGKLSKLKMKFEDIQIILNNKTNFTRIKIYLDYFELEKISKNFIIEIKKNFLSYFKYLNNITRKILFSSKKIKKDTAVFTDFLLLNYPYISGKIKKNEFEYLLNKKKGIFSFSKCSVIKVNSPTFFLWSKKIYPKCDCKTNDFLNRKYFNIFAKNIKFNSYFSNFDKCENCNVPFYHDVKSDIFIECQEIEIVFDTEGLNNNKINVWLFGELINKLKEGNLININVYFIQENSNVLEKNFDFGYFIALNIDICLMNLNILKENNLKFEMQKNLNENKIENKNFYDLFESFGFKRQFYVNFNKFIFYTYLNFKKKEINSISFANNSEINLPFFNNFFTPFLNIILDLSIIQKDYYNYVCKLNFSQKNNFFNINFYNDIFNNNNNENTQNDITQSRNLVFKSKIFTNNNNNNNLNNSFISNENFYKNNFSKDFKKFFNLGINNINSEDLLIKPLNLFLIFDDTKNDPFFNIVLKYSNNLYSNLISIYPYFSNDKKSLIDYFYINNNKIIFIQNIDYLTKLEINLISDLIENNLNSEIKEIENLNLNISFWFIANVNKINDLNNNNINRKNKDGMFIINDNNSNNMSKIKLKNFEKIVKNCEIIFNFSKKNLKKNYQIDVINENNFIDFFSDYNNELLNENVLLNYYKNFKKYNEINNNFDCKKNEFYNKENSYLSAKIIENYFIQKRNITNISFDDLFSLLRFSIFFSMLRNNYVNNKIIFPCTINNLNFIDVFLSIIIFEENTILKYGIENNNFHYLIKNILFYDYKNLIENIEKFLDKNNFNEENINNNIFMPKSKVLNKNQINFNENFIENNINKKEYCEFCKEIENINEGKEILHEFTKKLSDFIIINNEN